MVKQLITNLTIYSLALFYGLIVSIGVVWRLIRNFGVMRGAGRRDTRRLSVHLFSNVLNMIQYSE